MLTHVLKAAERSQAKEIIVVVAHNDTISQGLVRGSGAQLVLNTDLETGLGNTISLGCQNLDRLSQCCLILLADMPHVLPETINRIIDLVTESTDIVVAQNDDYSGVPVAFGRSHFPELTALKGDHGARHIWEGEKTVKKFVRVPILELKDYDSAPEG